MKKYQPHRFHFPKYLAEIIEFERRIREQIEIMTGSPAAKMLEEIQSRQRQIERITQTIAKPRLSDLLGFSKLDTEVLRLSEKISRQLRENANYARTFEVITRSQSTVMKSVFEGQRRILVLQEQVERFKELMVKPVHRVETILASIEASARVYRIEDSLWSSALSNTVSYQRFIEGQLKRLAYDYVQIAKRRAIVMDGCGEIAESIQGTFEIGLGIMGGAEQKIAPVPDVNVYRVSNQYLAFLYRSDVDIEAEIAFEEALPVRVTKLGTGLVMAVSQINEYSQRAGGNAIFRPTTRMMLACALIPSRIARSRQDFGEIVDSLFFLLYEGSGSDQCRLLRIVQDDVLNPLWSLKHLRLDFRHDIEHGKEISVKYKKVGQAYKALIGKEMPITAGDWARAQLSLYVQLLDMLNNAINVQQDKYSV